jgi:hypothetical protein
MNIETKTYSDGTTATGPAPLPDCSPRQQEVNQAAPIWATCPKCSNHERCEERGCADRASTVTAPMQDECPKCGTDEWDRITNRVAPGEVFNRCARCGNEWEAQ